MSGVERLGLGGKIEVIMITQRGTEAFRLPVASPSEAKAAFAAVEGWSKGDDIVVRYEMAWKAV